MLRFREKKTKKTPDTPSYLDLCMYIGTNKQMVYIWDTTEGDVFIRFVQTSSGQSGVNPIICPKLDTSENGKTLS